MNGPQTATDLPQIIHGEDADGRRAERAVSFCNIWDLVASGDPCPVCEDSFEDRLKRARGPRR